MNFDFEELRHLLRRSANDPAVAALIKCEPDQIARLAHDGYVEFKDKGVSAMFKEAPWVVTQNEINDPKMLHLDAFHFHRRGHDSHCQYAGTLPGGVAFNDSAADIIDKLGQPSAKGGGGFSTILNKAIPYWLKYSLGNDMLHFQFDSDGKVEMMTLYVQQQQPGSIAITE
jgi:hypothetical protein